jgi:hypothetical protein
VTGRLQRPLLALSALAALGASVWWARRVSPGADLAPAHLRLRPGETAEVRLVDYEPEVVALGFRVRFDAAVVAVEPEPASARVLAPDGGRIHLPVLRAPGVLEVPGVAVAGGRLLMPGKTLYRLTLRALRPGRSEIAVEDLVLVDVGEKRRAVPVRSGVVTVRVP